MRNTPGKDTGNRLFRWGVVFVSVALSSGVLAAGIFSYRSYERQVREEAQQRLTAIAELKAGEIAQWRRERLGDAALFHRNAVFADLVRRFVRAPADPEARRDLQVWLGRIQGAYRYDLVMLLDNRYVKRMIFPGRAERSLSFVSHGAEKLLRQDQVVMEDFYWNEENRRIYLKILIPVLAGAEGGPLAAVLALRIDPEAYLYPLIGRWPVPSATAESLLIRREGGDAVFLNALRFRADAALKQRISLQAGSDTPAVQAALGFEGLTEGRDYRGTPVLAAVLAVPDSPWFLVAKMDLSEVLAPLQERLALTALFIAILLACGGAVAGLLWRRRRNRFYRERYEAAEALRESEARLKAIASSAQDAIVMMDPEGRTTYWNPAAERILGYAGTEALGRDLHRLIAPPRYHEAHRAAFARFLRTGEGAAIGKTVEMEALRKDGTEITAALSLSAVNLHGEWHAVGIVRDITEQKAAAEKLRRTMGERQEANRKLQAAVERANAMVIEAQAANIAKGQFLANMSHEIRTPMNGVIGMTGVLLDTDLSPEQRRYAETIRASGEALLSIINDILDFSKMEADRLDLESLDFDLRATLEDTVELLAVRAHEKRLELTCRIDPDVPTYLRGDPGRLRQILLNLGGNAVKFTERGEVAIRVGLVREEADRVAVRFSVEDTGIGIPAGKMGLLFNAFEQLDASTTRRYGGTGLGLAISRRLVERMGGTIDVESEEGRGSVFRFTAVFDRQPPRGAAAERPRTNLRASRVLVVDDNATNRLVLSEQLAAWGVRHAEAEGAGKALEALRAARVAGDPFHIVLTDMQMPEMDGESLGKTIKADPDLRGTILVMMTSLGRRGDARRLGTIGFSAYLIKPVKQSQLYDCLATIAGGHPAGTVSETALVTRHTLSEARRRRIRILLAEDNPVNQQVALVMLEKMGVPADAVADGQEAIRAIETIPYDLVFMDVQMPVMDGFAATQAIRSGRTKAPRPDIPIVAMTAHAMQGDRERCLEAGMNDYIAKPVSPQALAEVLDRWLARNGAHSSSPPVRAEEDTARPPVFDLPALRERLMGDEETVRTVVAAFLEDTPRRIAGLRTAIEKGDAADAANRAHTLKGAAANLGGMALSETARAVEQAGRRERPEDLVSLLPEVERQFARLKRCMEEDLP